MNKKSEHQSPAAQAEPGAERDEGFLRRWSRRKHEVAEETDVIREAEAEAGDLPTVSEPPAGEKVLTDADMPPIGTLDEKSDFSMFLSSGVSETLRQQALRKLFLLPSMNRRCPLDSEYHDCHGYEPLGNVLTHEMREEMERTAQKLKDAAVSALRGDEKPSEASVDSKSAVKQEPQTNQEKRG